MRFPTTHRLTDETLMRRAAGGDHEAYGLLVGRHRRSALAVAQRVTRDRGLSEEVTQEAFLVAWLTSERFDAERGSVRGWLLTIVRRRALDVRAVRRFTPSLDDLDGEDGWGGGEYDETSVTVLQSDETARVRQLLARLPAVQAEAIELVYLEDLSRSEAAARLGVSSVAVKGRLRVGLEQLRRQVDGPALEW